MNIKRLIKDLEKRRIAVGAERDKLRDLVNTAEELEETCSRAHEDLTNAIDALSELA